MLRTLVQKEEIPQITLLLEEYPLAGINPEHIKALTQIYNLSVDDVDALIYSCVNYHTNLAQLRCFLAKGWQPEDILHAYAARETAGARLGKSATGISVRYILQLQRTFPSLAEDDDLGEKLVMLYNTIHEVMPWIRYADRAIECLCDIANDHELASFEAALDAITCPTKDFSRIGEYDD